MSDWNINQVALCFWSNFYDNVYEHPERPPQKVIENDDLIDKWAKDQSKKMEDRAKKENKGYDSKTTSVFDHDDIVVFDEEFADEHAEELEDYETE